VLAEWSESSEPVRRFGVEVPVEVAVEEEVFQSVQCTASLGIVLTPDPRSYTFAWIARTHLLKQWFFTVNQWVLLQRFEL